MCGIITAALPPSRDLGSAEDRGAQGLRTKRWRLTTLLYDCFDVPGTGTLACDGQSDRGSPISSISKSRARPKRRCLRRVSSMSNHPTRISTAPRWARSIAQARRSTAAAALLNSTRPNVAHRTHFRARFLRVGEIGHERIGERTAQNLFATKSAKTGNTRAH
jgi:hypothetical protein